MNLDSIVNSIGLIFDIAGAVLIFKFGLPEKIDRKGHGYLLLESVDQNEINKAKKYDKFGKLGLILLIIGFLLQIISNFI